MCANSDADWFIEHVMIRKGERVLRFACGTNFPGSDASQPIYTYLIVNIETESENTEFDDEFVNFKSNLLSLNNPASNLLTRFC